MAPMYATYPAYKYKIQAQDRVHNKDFANGIYGQKQRYYLKQDFFHISKSRMFRK